MPDSAASIALVTGASGGIGFELARCFARDGHGFIIASRREAGLNRAAEALHMAGAPRVEVVTADLSRSDGPPKVFQAVHEGGPYYPIPRPENQALFKRYEALADATPDVRFVGRLATYRYDNMDQVVGQALATFARLDAEVPPRAANDDAPPAVRRIAARG